MVVTRFAPSPTGYLHIGGARTALFSWLWARSSGGKFILRIEDTDLKRNTPSATGQVIEDLKWLGLEWDEGPEVGGESGPYFQSERLDIYKKYVDKLLDMGKAYYCFDSAEELAAERAKAQSSKGSVVYRMKGERPSREEAERARAEGKEVTVRFAIPQGEEIVVDDIVRGKVSFDPGELGDFIIQKSDGYPTYHFAVVVDDALMGVTHICRGQEHLMNTPLHQCLQRELGFEIPQYAHMSVTMSESGGKLSKRERANALRQAIGSRGDLDKAEVCKLCGVSEDELDGFLERKSALDMGIIDCIADYVGVKLPEINVIDFLRSGYLPETMVNFLALLGWNSGEEQEIMSVDELVKKFDISRLSKSNSYFDRGKLLAFNTEHIRMVEIGRLVEHFKRYLKAVGSPVLKGDDELLKRLLRINSGARTLEQIDQKCRFLFLSNDEIEYDPKAVKKVLLKKDGLGILRTIKGRLEEMSEVSEDGLEEMLRGLAAERGVGLGKVVQPLRVAMCGKPIGPPIFDSVELLGKDETLCRIENTLEKFCEQS